MSFRDWIVNILRQQFCQHENCYKDPTTTMDVWYCEDCGKKVSKAVAQPKDKETL
jgi:hypothetical protein